MRNLNFYRLEIASYYCNPFHTYIHIYVYVSMKLWVAVVRHVHLQFDSKHMSI